jgi:hypothetical protein
MEGSNLRFERMVIHKIWCFLLSGNQGRLHIMVLFRFFFLTWATAFGDGVPTFMMLQKVFGVLYLISD